MLREQKSGCFIKPYSLYFAQRLQTTSVFEKNIEETA
jgi:hypothetical protein